MGESIHTLHSSILSSLGAHSLTAFFSFLQFGEFIYTNHLFFLATGELIHSLVLFATVEFTHTGVHLFITLISPCNWGSSLSQTIFFYYNMRSLFTLSLYSSTTVLANEEFIRTMHFFILWNQEFTHSLHTSLLAIGGVNINKPSSFITIWEVYSLYHCPLLQ